MNNQMAKDTGKAWGISRKQVKRIHDWVEINVPPHRYAQAFTAVLRKRQNSNIQPQKKKAKRNKQIA